MSRGLQPQSDDGNLDGTRKSLICNVFKPDSSDIQKKASGLLGIELKSPENDEND